MVVRVEVPAGEAELAGDLLWQAGATAVGEATGDDGATVVLTADLDVCPPAVAARGWPVHEWVDDGAWQDGWRPYARAVRAGPFLVRPPWIAIPGSDGAVELLLDGGRAFGTGSHPSTTLALEVLAGLVRPGCSVLDVGCGSGALAIGAALLGAAAVVAVDNDPAAVEATSTNASLNGIVLDVRQEDAAAGGGEYDVVLANLGSPPVVDLATVLTDRTKAGGHLVLSGLLDERAAAVPASYPEMALVDERSADGWTALVLRRRRR